MINRDGKFKSIVCDTCGSETEANDNFNELIADAKTEGWEFKPDGSGWKHTCQPCWRKRNASGKHP